MGMIVGLLYAYRIVVMEVFVLHLIHANAHLIGPVTLVSFQFVDRVYSSHFKFKLIMF